jgi:hypothetical protein
LPDVLAEVIERLVADDWCRYSSDDEKRWFYAIGEEAHTEHQNGDYFPYLEMPRWQHSGPLARFVVRSKVAGKAKEIAEALKGRNWDSEFEKSESDKTAFGKLIQEWADSVCIEHLRRGIDLPSDQQIRADTGAEKVWLQELGKKYGKLVDKGARLAYLDLEDSRLEEATKCYLYGFRSASVVLSAAALEDSLKKMTQTDRFETYEELVKRSESKGLESALADWARKVFSLRNRVVHDSYEPEASETEDILDGVRKILSFIKR